MNDNVLDYFGKKLIEGALDNSISTLESILNKQAKSPRLIKLQDQLELFSNEEIKIIQKLMVLSVEELLFFTLLFFEENSDEIKIMIDSHDINNISDGLSGEIFGDYGWIEKYSKYKKLFDSL